ncbi:hypothetical protein GVN18_30135, partial [Pseudomonas sp. ODNR1LW]|nr:hypothetical protein [Pseudomonas sp. ODNR1LW]
VFKQGLRGIERDPTTGAFVALVAQPALPGAQSQSMKPGDVFQDGWRVSEISEYAVTLRRGRETRVVRLFG